MAEEKKLIGFLNLGNNQHLRAADLTPSFLESELPKSYALNLYFFDNPLPMGDGSPPSIIPAKP